MRVEDPEGIYRIANLLGFSPKENVDSTNYRDEYQLDDFGDVVSKEEDVPRG